MWENYIDNLVIYSFIAIHVLKTVVFGQTLTNLRDDIPYKNTWFIVLGTLLGFSILMMIYSDAKCTITLIFSLQRKNIENSQPNVYFRKVVFWGGPCPPLMIFFIIFGDVLKKVSKTSSGNIVTTFCSERADFHNFF